MCQNWHLAKLEYTARGYVIVYALWSKIDTFVVFPEIVPHILAMFSMLIHDEQTRTPCPFHEYPSIPRHRSPWGRLVSFDRPRERILEMAQFMAVERTVAALVVMTWRMANRSSIGMQFDPVFSRVRLPGLQA